MLGWDVMVFRKIPRPQPEKAEELLLARWATGVFGLKWLDDLVRSNRAVDLGGNGYPSRYSIAAGVLLPVISRGLPANSSPLVVGEDYSLPPGWNGKLEIDAEKFSACPSEEQLIIEAWDQS
jgi:hypothetical protein